MSRLDTMTQHWKGSTKARYLVLALRDFYIEQLHHLVSRSQTISNTRNTSDDVAEPEQQDSQEMSQPTDTTIPKISETDRWAIDYISSFRLRPLLEAIDTDCSGLITVSEANEFTTARPEKWT